MITTAKTQMISDGCIAIPADWVNSLGLDDGTSVSLSLSDSKIIIEKTHHPLEDMCSLLDDIEFTDSDFMQAKKSLFPFEDMEKGNSEKGSVIC
jgi:antitoxin component of MazEF toxin-antitoxin module